MSRPLRCVPALALALLPLLCACRSAPTREDWLSIGFESPRQTLHTFQTGLRGNDPHLEYDSFSEAFRREQNLSRVAYLQLRDEVFGRYPFLRNFARVQILSERREGDKTRTMIVQVSALFAKRWIEVRFVRDDFFSVSRFDLEENEKKVLADDFADFGTLLYSNEDGDALIVVLPTGSGIVPGGVTHVEIGQDWKIDGFREIDRPPEP